MSGGMFKPVAPALCAALLTAACGDGGSHYAGGRGGVVVAGGTLIVDWTVDGLKDPGECQQGGATTIDVTVQTTAGEDMGEYQADCGSFSTSIELPAGAYSATAVLVDDAGHDHTTPVDIEPFHIHGDDELTTPIDFPAGSFL